MRFPIRLAALAASLALAPAALAEPTAFRAPRLAATAITLEEPPQAKAAAPTVDAAGRLRVASVRALAKAVAPAAWVPADGGYVARIRATSAGAQGLRVKLALGGVPGPVELRARGTGGDLVAMTVDPRLGPEAWTPWTEGETQEIELYSDVEPAQEAVQVESLLHFTASPFAKAASSCTLSTACTSGDELLDAAIAERKKSVMRISFVDGASGFVCSATLIDTPQRPAAYVLTANHCIDNAASAASVTAFWFYEASACGSLIQSPAAIQTAGGGELTFTNYNLDASLLLLNRAPPAGALYAPVNAALLEAPEPVVSISHPKGDTSRWATGTVGRLLRDNDRPYDMYSVNFSRGIIEPGSSGSGLFTRGPTGSLELRAILSQGALDLSCSQPTLFTLYGRMEALYPQMAHYIGAATRAADDAPNRPVEVSASVWDVSLEAKASEVVVGDKRIDYAGDIDVYRFTLGTAAYVTAYTEGALDTVGTLLAADGKPWEANDDAEWSPPRSNLNFGITRRLPAGTHYVHVAAWEPQQTGAYALRLRADLVDDNYTDLWWNPAEPGWGINVNHQGDILFATLFTYDRGGRPLWLVMSRGERQPDGSYQGVLYRTTGAPFTAAWFAATPQPVGTMRFVFHHAGAATLTYTFENTTLTKSLSRQGFSTAPTCGWSGFDRTFATNYQDLWYDPNEPGWGLNLAHQGNILFATLFTYGADGRDTWFVMSEGLPNVSGAFQGTLYRMSGPAFDTQPWTRATPTAVGMMGIRFANGNDATLTYSVDGATVSRRIQRQVFSSPRTRCES